ncbi:hypothetical protein [Halalkalibacterium halodurans]|uniref:hypothetical protein n=1 Tax=Halalkalibacterium halodurans TaxID=86665 RepID=UPI002AAA2757|nr:hypothetical protein [Halalkalibacterium halodurans]MDY7224707.1 hypothetical protein [Halalkalibacterium halodurans]MDY7243222.1 hypothetical protein [Halalkalibacterium halodurans]
MKIESTSFNIFYPRIQNLRRKLFEFEDNLESFFFTPFEGHPIPDDAPSNIPRISAKSKNGHSHMDVSQDRLSFQTNYDHRFNGEWARCLGYLNDRIIPITKIIQTLVNNQFLYSGLTTVIFIEHNDPINHMLKRYFDVQQSNNPFDINLKFTYVIDEKYYINIGINNVRTYSGNANVKNVVPAYLDKINEGVVISLDINDRYGYNYIKEYNSGLVEVKEIITKTSRVVEKNLEEIFEQGVFNL